MPIDLEAQLRTLGRALNTQTLPVSASEASGRTPNVEEPLVTDLEQVRGPDDAPVGAVDASKHRWLLPTAAASVVVMGLIGLVAVLDRSPAPSSPALTVDEPITSSSGGPASTTTQEPSTTFAAAPPESLDAKIIPAATGRLRPDLFPIIRDPDVTDAFGQYRAESTGVVAGLVGRVEADRLFDGVRIELLADPGDQTLTGDRQTVEIDGTEVDIYAGIDGPGTSTVVLPGEPTIVVTAQDPVSFLHDSGLGVVTATADGFSINEAALPAGYQTVVEPAIEPIGALSAGTATSLANSDGPSVGVSLSNPVASYAITDVLERTEVNGIPAWAAATPGGYTIIWPVSETTWAQARVRGGADESLSLADSVTFAAAIDFVGETQWRAYYRVAEPWFQESDAFIAIDRGRRDGVEVGMLVESNGAPIGQVAEVSESTSNVLPVPNPDFTINATVSSNNATASASDCRVRGGNDHVGYVCDRPFNEQERIGAEIIATGNPPMIPEGTSFGTITSITEINGEQVALLNIFDQFPIAGDSATVVKPAT